VRLIAADGEQLGVVTPQEALAKARESGLDVVVIAEQAQPPVCKVMDFGKFTFEKKKKEHESKKKQKVTQVKEVKFRPNIDDHDYDFKMKNIIRFIEEGDKVKATAKRIADETGGRCLGMACDVTNKDDIDALVKATVEAFGGISTFVNNVGPGPRHADPTAITEEELVNAYRLNTVSAYRMSMACLPHLLKAENPSITNSGSFASAVPAYDILAYGTAKAALNQMMISIAHLLAHKVRVNTILIGTVMTEGYGDAGLDAATQERLKHPDNLIGRTGQPRDIANAMLWLASPAAAWVSGQIVKVHGGGSVVRLFGQ